MGTMNANDATRELLARGKIELDGLVPWGSNYTFLATIHAGARELNVIYKPCNGERPLWDFPTGSLANREYAAYLVSQALGWPNVPPTVLRDGPHGFGMVQMFIPFVDGQQFFTLRQAHREEMKRIAAFDAIVNNTDRKGGHVLLGEDDKIWCIDHGVTFHEYPKLRTVIWDFVDQPVPAAALDDLRTLLSRLARGEPLTNALSELLSNREMRALRQRITELIEKGIYPQPPEDWPAVPWPPV
ncbi:MAG: SCO1664 family protein [Chloroflexi bacterium]|nr:SCO1664 family protein [Chloroflexota bacterium]